VVRLTCICALAGVLVAGCTTSKKQPVKAMATVSSTTTTVLPVPTTLPTTTTTVVPATVPTTTTAPEPEPPAPQEVVADAGDDIAIWIAMGRCEQPGDGWMGVRWSHRGPTYQGGLGFWYGTWDAYKRGTSAENIDNAGDATPMQQIEVARRVRDAHGYHAWGCAAKVGV
jgi:hypothetical protein